MAALSFDSAYRQVKRGPLAPVYYLTGDEDVLKDELVALLVDRAVEPASRDFNVDVRSAADLDAEQVHALVETPPMLAERRAVVIRALEQWRRTARVWQVLERYVQNPSPTTVLVLVHGVGQKPHGTLATAATHVDVAPLSADRVARWAAARAKRAGVALTEDAVRLLVDAVGADLGVLGMEIEKLAAAASDGPLDVAVVAGLVGVRYGETPSDWVAAVAIRDVPRAIGMLERVLAASGVSAVRLVASLGTQLIGVRFAAQLRADGMPSARAERAVLDAIRRARPPGLRSWKDEARAWVGAAARWTPAELDRTIRAAYEADRALKSTTVSDDAGILSAMLLQLAPQRRAA